MINIGIFEAILTVGLLILGTAYLILDRKINELHKRLDVVSHSVESRNKAIAAQRVMRQSPGVDARGRTTRRDTDDLPRTGRMTQGVKRVRFDATASLSNDDRLPGGSGPEAT